MTTPRLALELRSIDKSFGTTVALSGASLAVRPGTLHMLLGENGAGKTTLLRIAAGFEQADAGVVLVGGREVQWRKPAEALAAGVATVQQHFSLVPAMTVAENVALAGAKLAASFEPERAAQTVREIAGRVGLSVHPQEIVGNLPVAGQQRVEIIKALSRAPRILILDEPTAVLAPSEAAQLYEWLRIYVGKGNTAIVVTHHVREARRHGSAITVLRRGRTVLDIPQRGESEREVVAAILGAPPETPAPAARPAPGVSDEVVLRAVDITVPNAEGAVRLRHASLAVARGEIMGVAGIDGAGHHELLRALAGRLSVTDGTITRPAAVAFVPEDRLRDGIIPEFTLTENFMLRGLGVRRGAVPWDEAARRTAQCIDAYDVRGATPHTRAEALSGGNQQRFVLARELDEAPTAIIAENPTRGLDIKAASMVLHLLRDRAAAGAAVVVYSTDIDELLQIADRVVVCQGGTLHAVPRNADAIGAAMIGAA